MFGLDLKQVGLSSGQFGSVRVHLGQFGSNRVSSGRLKSGQFGSNSVNTILSSFFSYYCSFYESFKTFFLIVVIFTNFQLKKEKKMLLLIQKSKHINIINIIHKQKLVISIQVVHAL